MQPDERTGIGVRHLIGYEFNLTCGHFAQVEVNEDYEPVDEQGNETGGVYTCPICGEEEQP